MPFFGEKLPCECSHDFSLLATESSSMDAISVTLGVVALFKTCIDSFEYFKAASGLKRNFEILLVKLDFERERLLVWGDVIGIGKAANMKRAPYTRI